LAPSRSLSIAEKPLTNISPSVQGQGLPSFCSNIHGAQEYMAASPLWASASLQLVPCRKYQGPSGGHGVTSLHSTPAILQLPGSDIPLFQTQPQRVILTRVGQHPRCGARIQTQLSQSSRQLSNNSKWENQPIFLHSSTF